MKRTLLSALSPFAVFLASCGPSAAGDSPAQVRADFSVTTIGRFSEPWAMALLPGGDLALVTERRGRLKLWQAGRPNRDVTGVPTVAYGGDGGLGDIVLAPDYATSRMVYLSWAEPGPGDTRGAAVGRARLVLGDRPRLEALEVIWRQPKVRGNAHYSHRFAFAPDGRSLYVASGDRRLMTPAQDRRSELGKIVRIALQGRLPLRHDIVSMGHRNILGLKFDDQGRLWDLEHGPAGGDELNLVSPGQNYGWPVVSQGDHYDGRKIPRHATRPDFAAPAISWNPVIAPGDFVFYRGTMFPQWRGQAIIAGLKSRALVRVGIRGESGQELARYPMSNRLREIVEASDGALLVLEDGPGARLLRLAR